jgi:thiol-disulfide isomerase/thioredoxin
MKLKKSLAFSAIAAMTAMSAWAGNYTLTVPMTDDEVGAMVYLVNYDTGLNVDSIHLDEPTAVFKGTIDEPFIGRLMMDGKRSRPFIVEDGNIEVDLKAGEAKGTPLNAKNAEMGAAVSDIMTRYKAATTDEQRQAIENEYNSTIDRYMSENINNVIGYMIFLEKAYEMSPSEVIALVDANPSLKKYNRVNKLIKANEMKAATQPGNKFADFEIEYNGQSHRLSDVVGKGDYVLVDFWASWCGPCIRQTAVLKDIYKEYKDQGLKVLGVAVWDKPEDTFKAIEQHELPWESWVNGGNVPTDTYGISGIPCIILFGPDGTIISRDKQDDALKADVKEAMSKK